MNHNVFWNIVESGWREATDFVALRECLTKNINGASPHEVETFQASFHDLRKELLRADHLCASYLLEDEYLSNEAFHRYTELIVVAGREAFCRVSASADDIVDIRRLEGLSGIEIEAGMFFEIGMDALQRRQDSTEYLRACFKTLVEPIVPDAVSYRGLRGLDIVTRQNCSDLVPRVLERYGRYGDDPIRM